jgi:hypothetical protein
VPTSAAIIALELDALAALHAYELPQKDNLCGCFWGAIALRAAGIEAIDGEPVDQDLLAAQAGTTLPEGDPHTFVPAGETPRRDYRLPLPVAADPHTGGTSARALARALERLSGGRLGVVPVAGPWSRDSVVELVETGAAAARTTLIANVRTGRLWGSRPHPSALLAYLAGHDVETPPPDWDTGHYVNLAALLRGPVGTLVVVRDSYRSLGWNAHHLQPADALARALQRGDGREGGVLFICPSADDPPLRVRLREAGYAVRHWDNGTPDGADDG